MNGIGGRSLEIMQDNLTYLVEKYSSTILRVAYTYLKNKADAEDTVQDVFIKIMDKSPVFENEAAQKAWIIKTTVNMCKNKLNLFWNRNKTSLDEITEIGKEDTYNTDSEVLKAVLALPEKYRIVIYMCYYEGYTAVQTAKILGKSDSTVRTLLMRAKEKLKITLKEEYDFE